MELDLVRNGKECGFHFTARGNAGASACSRYQIQRDLVHYLEKRQYLVNRGQRPLPRNRNEINAQLAGRTQPICAN